MDSELIAQGMQALSEMDADVAEAFASYGPPPPRLRPPGFETFLATIVSQQISAKVARVIMGRVTDLLPELSADALLSVEAQALRDAGLSWRKIEYARGLAEAVQSGTFDIDGLAGMEDSQVIEAITALRGFGRWSAEIYLMFSLKRQDIFPADDLALQVALGRLKNLDQKPTAGQAREQIAHWSPWRSVGALFLWHYYHGRPV